MVVAEIAVAEVLGKVVEAREGEEETAPADKAVESLPARAT